MREIYEPFNNAEEVWFWFCCSILARGDGLRSKSDYPGKLRSCEISDIYRIIKQMRLHNEISNRHLRVMSKWGKAGVSPFYERSAKRSEIKLWEYGMCVLDMYLKNKRIL